MSVSAAQRVFFYDYEPTLTSLQEAVLEGLSERPYAIPPKFFYDHLGSQLFEQICALPEYYLTRTEMAILRANVGEIAELIGSRCVLVEPGSGSSTKVRILLEELRPSAYLPMDISKDFLRSAAAEVAAQYPWLDVHAACLDFTEGMELPYGPAGVQRLAFFPGSSLGNFEPAAAIRFLREIARVVAPHGGLLIGIDLKKDPAILEAAYDDRQGITAAFNMNLLRRLNTELAANFDLHSFYHQAHYNTALGRVEMHLVSAQAQTVNVAGRRYAFAKGETIHTENSYKYSVAEFQQLARQAGFEPVRVWTDEQALFSVHYLTVAGSP